MRKRIFGNEALRVFDCEGCSARRKELEAYKKKVSKAIDNYCRDCNWLLDIKYCTPKKCKVFELKQKLSHKATRTKTVTEEKDLE